MANIILWEESKNKCVFVFVFLGVYFRGARPE